MLPFILTTIKKESTIDVILPSESKARLTSLIRVFKSGSSKVQNWNADGTAEIMRMLWNCRRFEVTKKVSGQGTPLRRWSNQHECANSCQYMADCFDLVVKALLGHASHAFPIACILAVWIERAILADGFEIIQLAGSCICNRWELLVLVEQGSFSKLFMRCESGNDMVRIVLNRIKPSFDKLDLTYNVCFWSIFLAFSYDLTWLFFNTLTKITKDLLA